jgi:hypothetical protein
MLSFVRPTNSYNFQAYAVSSDLRWKKRIQPLGQALEKVLNISGVSYQFRTDEFPDKNFLDGTQIGFIAQHLEAVVPEVVQTNAQGWKTVQYSSLVPVLVEAIKEQNQVMEEQAREIKELRRNQVMEEQAREIKELRRDFGDLRELFAQLARQ